MANIGLNLLDPYSWADRQFRNGPLGGPGFPGILRLPLPAQQVLLRGGVPQPAPAPPAPAKRAGLLERLFATPKEYEGLLSPESIQSARKNQILQLGIGLLANSGPRPVGSPGSSFGERIGGALQQVPNWNETLAQLVQQRMALQPKQGELKTVDAGDRILFYDQSGQLVREEPKGQLPAQNGDQTNEYATRANGLRSQFLTQTANERGVAQAYQAVLAADKSPAGDIALVYGFMKMVDPTSAVREGEFATAQNAGSIPERVRAMYNKAVSGERLTDDVRADFIKQATNRAERSRAGLKRVIDDYHRRAKRVNVDPADAAYDYFTGSEPVSAKPSAHPALGW